MELSTHAKDSIDLPEGNTPCSSTGENEIRIESGEPATDEHAPFLPVNEFEELQGFEETWSPESLGPGFVWIQTGNRSLFNFSSTTGRRPRKNNSN